jgi:hypothetical protein
MIDKQMSILDLSDRLDAGVLFRPPDDKLRVDAFVPKIGRQSHAANLVELPNGAVPIPVSCRPAMA